MSPLNLSPVIATATLLGALAVGCGIDNAPPRPSSSGRPTPATTTDFSSGGWTTISARDVVVATVNGAPVSRDSMERQRQANPDMASSSILDSLVELEVVAQEAMRRGYASSPRVIATWRQALAQQYLHKGFEGSHSHEEIDPCAVFRHPYVRKQYVHPPVYWAAQLMVQCCDPMTSACDGPEEVACFASAAEVMHKVFEELKPLFAKYAGGDPDAASAALQHFADQNRARYPDVGFQEFKFFYDKNQTEEEQRGKYTLIHRAVALALIDAPMVELVAPVQSSYGWHVMIKMRHKPGINKSCTDPDVSAEIRENAYPAFLSSAFRRLSKQLTDKYQVRLSPERLDLLDSKR